MSRIPLLVLYIYFFPAIAFGQSLPTPSDWLDKLRLGGYVIVFRHTATTSDAIASDPMSNPAKNADPMNNPIKSAGAERQLSEQGRAQAKAIGEAMRKLRIPVGRVMTSILQRAVDTGTLLGFSEVTPTLDLAEIGPAISRDEIGRRAEALRRLVALGPPINNNLVIVSHKPNLIEAFGSNWSDIREGEASVFEPEGDGGFRLIVRIRANEWSALLQTTH